MQRLNAIDAISPAFTRTHQLLFLPFRLGRSWKLAATSYLAFAGSFFFPFPSIYAAIVFFIPGIPHTVRLLFTVFAFVGTLIYFVIYYCFVRLQLVDFEMVVTLQKMVAPMWRKYSAKVWPWIAAKIAVAVISALIIIPILIGSAKSLVGVVSAMGAAGPHPDPAVVARMMSTFLGFYFLLFALFLIPKTFATLLDDFVLPFFLLEDLPFFAALRRGFDVFIADPLHCILYLGLKFILAIVGYMMQSIALQICMIPIVLIGLLFVFLGSLIYRSAGTAGHLVAIAGAVLLGIAFFAVIVYVSFLAIGYLLILLDAYAIYFLGGRYPLLGSLLDPGPGAPFAPPPVFPSQDERKDSDGGPPMPMNPAIA